MMSQAVVEFCQGLQSTLLAVEDRLAKAKAAFDAGGANVQSEAEKQVEKASEHLSAFKIKAARMAAEIRAELPEKVEAVEAGLKDFGLEAQVAMRHAVVFLAEGASKGAEGAAAILKRGAERAHELADTLRHDTAVTVRDEEPTNDTARG
jgi:hypothetical protein